MYIYTKLRKIRLVLIRGQNKTATIATIYSTWRGWKELEQEEFGTVTSSQDSLIRVRRMHAVVHEFRAKACKSLWDGSRKCLVGK